MNCVCAEVLGRSALWVGTWLLLFWGVGGGSVLKSKKCFVGLFFGGCFFRGKGWALCVLKSMGEVFWLFLFVVFSVQSISVY